MNTKTRQPLGHCPPTPSTPVLPGPELGHELAPQAMTPAPETVDRAWFHGEGLAFPTTVPTLPARGKLGQPRGPGSFAARHSSPSRPPPMPSGKPKFR